MTEQGNTICPAITWRGHKNGFGNIWQQQTQMNRKWFPLAFKQKINVL
jgi:hypothetical protein